MDGEPGRYSYNVRRRGENLVSVRIVGRFDTDLERLLTSERNASVEGYTFGVHASETAMGS